MQHQFTAVVFGTWLGLITCTSQIEGQAVALPGVSSGSVEAVLVDANDDGQLDRLREVVEVEGVLVTPPISYNELGIFSAINGDAAVVLYDPTEAHIGALDAGTRVRATGWLSSFQGQEQIVVSSVETLGSAPVPAPSAVKIGELGEAWAAKLVHVVGTLRVSQDDGSLRARLVDATGSIGIVISPEILTEAGRLEQILASDGRPAAVQGLLLQNGSAVESSSEYLILPLAPDDLMLPIVPPYREIVGGVLLLLLVGLAVHLALKRRAAEKIAAEQHALANRLLNSESALRDAEQRMRHLLVTSPSIIYAVSVADGKVWTSWISENVCWILGYTTEEALAPAWFADCLHPEDRERVLHGFAALAFGACSNEHVSDEYRFRHRNGTYRWFRNDLWVVEREGERGELVGASVDVTEQKEATNALASAEAHYRRLVETSPYGIFAVDAKGRFTEVNPLIARAFERSVGEMLGESIFEVLPAESLPIIADEFERQRFDPEYRSDFEMTIRNSTGDRLLHVRSAPILRGDVVIGAHGVLRDITEERSREARIRLLATALENVSHGVAITDGSQRLVFANGEFRKLLGLQRDAEDLPATDALLPDGEAGDQLGEIRQALKATGRWSGRMWRRRVDDGRVVPVDAAVGRVPHPEDGEPLTLTICSDATDSLVQEQQLRRAERLSSLGTLVGGVAHELNNPLNAVINFAVLLLEQAKSEDEREDLETIVREGERAAAIVASLRDILRNAGEESAPKAPVDVNELVTRAVEKRRERLAASNIAIEFDTGEGLPAASADPGQMERVLLNLIDNAEQAMADHRGGGQLRVLTGRGVLGVQIVVQDDGPGIASDNLERIFDPFWTTKDPGKGTGLGLSEAHNIVAEHEGRISVQSTEGAGATFRVDLPGLPTESVVAEAETIRTDGLRVLIVDDEPSVRTLLVRFLQRAGHVAEEAKEGADALRMLGAARYDVILSDLRMPGMGGEELVDRLRAEGGGMDRRVVLMSGDATGLSESTHLSGIPILLKPVTLTDVTAALESRVAAASAR